MKFTDFTQERRNFWSAENEKKHYRLFADGVTPNGCWLINPRMRELVDIDMNTGNDIYGETVNFEYCGTVPGFFQFLKD